MPKYNRQIDLGVNFWLSNEEIDVLFECLRKVCKEKHDSNAHDLAKFFAVAFESNVGESGESNILDN
jgi:hypothetical protein